MELQITTLIENNPSDQGQLLFEHGLSFYIEADGKNLLFDTGQSGDFIENAKALNKDLNKLDVCLISHGHYDHSGGLKRLVNEIDKIPLLIVGEEFFKPKYKKESKFKFRYNGSSFEEAFLTKNQIPLRKVKEDKVALTDHILIFHNFHRHTDFETRNCKFYLKENNKYTPDEFDDEIALGIVTEKGLVVIVGCSHIGIVNILKTISERVNIPIYAVVGGTHLIEADEGRMEKTMNSFQEMGIQLIAVSHCTGEKGIRFLQQNLKNKFQYNNTGNVIQI